jgi:hypothetical protein
VDFSIFRACFGGYGDYLAHGCYVLI